MCRFFSVSRSGYYSFVKCLDVPDRDEPIAKLISECHALCGRTYGCRRVQIWLERNKRLHLNYKTVWRVMRKYGLLSIIRRRNYHKYDGHIYKYPNLLNRNFSASEPNQKWVTDISYIPTKQGFLYLSIIRDLFDNSIIAYKTSTQQSIRLVLDTLKQAMEKEVVTAELQLHSDQGFQYTSAGYFNLTQKYGITLSMSRRGNPYDNAMAENFFSILKTECIRLNKPNTFAQAQLLIDDYIYFYNHERIQLKTKLTPLEKRRQLE